MTETTQRTRFTLRDHCRPELGRGTATVSREDLLACVADAERLAEIEAALQREQEETFFEDGLEGDLQSEGITRIGQAYMEGRTEVLSDLQRILNGGESDE